MKKLGLLVAVFAMLLVADVAQAQSQIGLFNSRNGGNGRGLQIGLVNRSNNNGGNAQNFARGNRAQRERVIIREVEVQRDRGHVHNANFQRARFSDFSTGYYVPPPAPLILVDPHAGCSGAQRLSSYSGGCGASGLQFASPPCR